MIRIALIGKTGAGKSALGNTLIGHDAFESSISAESVTTTCTVAEGQLKSGLKLKVLDTPGLIDTRGRNVKSEVTNAIAHLSPGPHAFIIVLRPDRATPEERKVIAEMRGLFGDETFLHYTSIVMTRKADLKRKGKNIDIHEYVQNLAAKEIKELYELCGKRIVAVENNTASEKDRKEYAEEIVRMIDKTKYFSHEYFQVTQRLWIQEKIRENQIRQLQAEIENIAARRKLIFCSIL